MGKPFTYFPLSNGQVLHRHSHNLNESSVIKNATFADVAIFDPPWFTTKYAWTLAPASPPRDHRCLPCARGVVVLLHGWASHAERWPPVLLSYLTELGYRVLAPTYADTFVSIAQAARDLEGVICLAEDRAALCNPRCAAASAYPCVHVIGHSMGGMIAQAFIAHTASSTKCWRGGRVKLCSVTLCGTSAPVSQSIYGDESLPDDVARASRVICENALRTVDRVLSSLREYVSRPDLGRDEHVDKVLSAFHGTIDSLRAFSKGELSVLLEFARDVPETSAKMRAALVGDENSRAPLVSRTMHVNTAIRNVAQMRAILQWMCSTCDEDLVRHRVGARIWQERAQADAGPTRSECEYVPPHVTVILSRNDRLFPPQHAQLITNHLGPHVRTSSYTVAGEDHSMRGLFASREFLRTLTRTLRAGP